MPGKLSLAKSLRSHLRVEQLEARTLLSGVGPTAVEQLFLEQLNDARANPAAYGTSIGVDLSSVAPSQPLAFNGLLNRAALTHSQDMNDRAYFAHNTPEGVTPGGQMSAAGYAWNSYGQSIAGGSAFPQTADALSGLITDSGVPDLGHRRHLLAIDSYFKSQNEVGIGIVLNGTGPLTNYYTIDTGKGSSSSPILTGVVYNDANHTGHYDIGEGLSGVTVTISDVGSVTTWTTGGYSIAVAPGTHTVTISGGSLAASISNTVTVGSQNVRLNFTASTTSPAPTPAPSPSAQDVAYVSNLYQLTLHRTPSSSDVAFWSQAVRTYGTYAVANALDHSAEARSILVRSWYVSYLGRQAGPGEEQGWVSAMVAGATEEQVINGIIGSQEYYNRAQTLFTSGSQDQRFVMAVYNNLLHRGVDTAGLNFWVSNIPAVGRSAVAGALEYSLECRGYTIAQCYSDMLHRTAASSELNYWGSTPLSLTDIRVAVLASQECYQKS